MFTWRSTQQGSCSDLISSISTPLQKEPPSLRLQITPKCICKKKGSQINFVCVCIYVCACVRWAMLWCNPHETGAQRADAGSYRKRDGVGERVGETQRRSLALRSRAECSFFRAHLTWQAAPQCLLFDIRPVLVRLVDVTGHSKMWTLSQKSMPGWVCLPGMLELSGKDRRKNGGRRWEMAQSVDRHAD